VAGRNKEIQALLRRLQTKEARQAGWVVQYQRGSKHYRVFRNGTWVTTFPHTGGKGRGIHNGRAALKRAGFKP
jgi:hypothetical protein